MMDAGLIVLTAFISPFRAERAMVREMVGDGDFIEIFVDTPLAEAERRDTKGLYSKARAGKLANFTGVDSPYETPEAPDIRIDTMAMDAEAAADLIVALSGRRSALISASRIGAQAKPAGRWPSEGRMSKKPQRAPDVAVEEAAGRAAAGPARRRPDPDQRLARLRQLADAQRLQPRLHLLPDRPALPGRHAAERPGQLPPAELRARHGPARDSAAPLCRLALPDLAARERARRRTSAPTRISTGSTCRATPRPPATSTSTSSRVDRAGRVIFVNTKFSCLATMSITHGFKPLVEAALHLPARRRGPLPSERPRHAGRRAGLSSPRSAAPT